jgi:hypothetical protein
VDLKYNNFSGSGPNTPIVWTSSSVTPPHPGIFISGANITLPVGNYQIVWSDVVSTGCNIFLPGNSDMFLMVGAIQHISDSFTDGGACITSVPQTGNFTNFTISGGPVIVHCESTDVRQVNCRILKQ